MHQILCRFSDLTGRPSLQNQAYPHSQLPNEVRVAAASQQFASHCHREITQDANLNKTHLLSSSQHPVSNITACIAAHTQGCQGCGHQAKRWQLQEFAMCL